MDIFQAIREGIAKQLNIEEESIDIGSRLLEDLRADSLDIVVMVMQFEQTFDIEIPDDDLLKIRTVGDIVEYVEKYQRG